MSKYKETARVISQESLADQIYSIWIQTDHLAACAKPGQFVSVYSKDHAMLLPRPISICEIRENTIRLVYRVVGQGTKEFSGYAAGDSIDLMGPLGNGFSWDSSKRAFLIGGGIGIPPMLELAKQLPGEKHVILGYKDEQLFLKDEFVPYANSVNVATEDGSVGTKGNVLDAIIANGLEADILYACGPMPMLRALQTYAKEHNMEAFISLEERMACGVGACLGCVCQSEDVDAHTNVKNKRICKEGPVFNAQEVRI